MHDVTLSDLRASWERHLTAGNKAKGTVRVYVAALDHLVAVIGDRPIDGITRADIEAFIVDRQAVWKPATVSIDYRSLQQFFLWAIDEGEIDQSPMARMRPPRVPQTPPDVVTDVAWEKLLDACRGKDFESRRDTAVLWLFMSSGIRLSELTNIRLDEIDVPQRTLRVLGKGGRYRTPRFDPLAANAIERYLRSRRRHTYADLPWLWLGKKGRMTPNGMYQAVRRRARQAGVTLHPHLFRHTFAHRFLEAGGQEGDLIALAGWRNRAMLARYGASAAEVRAHIAYDRVMLNREK